MCVCVCDNKFWGIEFIFTGKAHTIIIIIIIHSHKNLKPSPRKQAALSIFTKSRSDLISSSTLWQKYDKNETNMYIHMKRG